MLGIFAPSLLTRVGSNATTNPWPKKHFFALQLVRPTAPELPSYFAQHRKTCVETRGEGFPWLVLQVTLGGTHGSVNQQAKVLQLDPTNHSPLLCSRFVRILPSFTIISITFL